MQPALQENPMTEQDQKQPFRDHLLSYLLLQASQAVSAQFSDTLKARAIPVRQWRVLGSLWDGNSMTLGELAEAILCEQSSTTRLVDRLVDAGLVAKRPDPDDRRKVHLHLTDKGREETERLVDLALDLERRVAAAYGIDGTEALKSSLRILIETASERATVDR